MIKVKKADPFPPNTNPFLCDAFHMGTPIGSNVMVMMGNHSGERCPYLIVINVETGERVRIIFEESGATRSVADKIVNALRGGN